MKFGEKYSTGVVWQDFQHRQLIDLLYKLKKEKVEKADSNVIRLSAAFLAMYVHHHFTLEEEHMDLYCYPGMELHKKGHKDYIKRIKVFREKQFDCDDNAVDGLIQTISHWILNHILTDDKKLGSYIIKAEQKSK